MKRQFKPEAWKRKGKNVNRVKLERQRRKMEQKVKNGFHWMDTSRLSLSFKGTPKGFVASIMVMFDTPLPREYVKRKLEEAFGGRG